MSQQDRLVIRIPAITQLGQDGFLQSTAESSVVVAPDGESAEPVMSGDVTSQGPLAAGCRLLAGPQGRTKGRDRSVSLDQLWSEFTKGLEIPTNDRSDYDKLLVVNQKLIVRLEKATVPVRDHSAVGVTHVRTGPPECQLIVSSALSRRARPFPPHPPSNQLKELVVTADERRCRVNGVQSCDLHNNPAPNPIKSKSKSRLRSNSTIRVVQAQNINLDTINSGLWTGSAHGRCPAQKGNDLSDGSRRATQEVF
ncbi:hypothetical protein B0H11DRAFT_1914952 [Mycena galericulata]|nr:hypothetical protein B0H11DRAFT_1914952 [Mycena galericulata]